MKVLNKETAIDRMNTFGSQNIPFLFIIDYAQEHSYVEPLDQIVPSVCLYRFGETNNIPDTDTRYTGIIDWDFVSPSPADYRRSFDAVQRNLLSGNSYLTNLTCKVPLHTNLTLKEMFLHSHTLYKLWLKERFVCFSPEIFVRMEEGIIKSFPMKGTIDATLPHAAMTLLNDSKEAAEHATIVDLIRNDLSMVSDHVRVTSYRYIDRLQTNQGPILQTSSEICGTLPDDYTRRIGDILFRLLPAGSITGAPKRRTIQIIAEAEGYERGFYTGVMGCYANGRLDSAVMIRFIEQDNGQFYFKAGGGITAQSQWENEYKEIKQKIYVPIY